MYTNLKYKKIYIHTKKIYNKPSLNFFFFTLLFFGCHHSVVRVSTKVRFVIHKIVIVHSCVQYAVLISALQKDNYLRLQLLSFKMARTPRLRACLHGGGGPREGEVSCSGSPHLLCKRDQIRMRNNMDRRVTPLSGLPHLPGVPHLHVNRP